MTEASALRTAIEGCDAAIYAYGMVGAHSSGAAVPRARKGLSAYRAHREVLQARLGEPVGAPSAFDLPFAVDGQSEASRLAALVDNRMAAVFADLAAASTGADRTSAVAAAMESAARAVTWGAPSQAFPH